MSQEFLQGMQFHGTSRQNAKSIAKGGLRASVIGSVGGGVYVSDKVSLANAYGAKEVTRSRRTGVLFGVRTQGPPQATAPGLATYSPDQLTVVHRQNVHASSSRRSILRAAGVPSLPDTGPDRPAPTPVSQLPKTEIKKRLAAKKAGPDFPREGYAGLPVM